MGAQLHSFYSLPKPSKHQHPSLEEQPRNSSYDLPRSFGSEGHVRASLSGLELENEEVYTFKTPNNALATDNYDLPTLPGSVYQIPRTFTFDRNHNALGMGATDSPGAPPPRPPKPGQISEQWGIIQHNGESASVAAIPRRNTLPAVENFRLYRASSFETNDHPQQLSFSSSSQSVESVNDGFSSYLRTKAAVARSDSGDSEDNYVPMNPGSSSSPFNTASANNPQGIYIPMSPGPHHFHFPTVSSATLPTRKRSTASLCHRPGRLSDITPPPVDRNLKPKPTPLDLRNNLVIDELPHKSPVTKSWIRPVPVMNSISTQNCRPISTQSITSTDSADSEDNYVTMLYVVLSSYLLSYAFKQQNPVSTSPANSGTSSPASRKCVNVDYLDLDFKPNSPIPHRKPSTSSITSDEKVDYVQVDKEKTQALQNTMLEWTDVRQSSESAKGMKS
ncbi:GAB2 protein, partial [Polyodon spathula]|nr:GAB2 protein [Polyodon spathula]